MLPAHFLRKIPKEKIVYSHVAGHYQQTPNLLIDTHGMDVIDPVWALLNETYQLFGAFPTLLERDSNIPPLPVLMREVDKIAQIQTNHSSQKHTTQYYRPAEPMGIGLQGSA